MTVLDVCPSSSGAAGLRMRRDIFGGGGVQGTCEWMEGVLKTQGSQDISPPKDTGETPLPAQPHEAAYAGIEHLAAAAAAAAAEDASPIMENKPETLPTQKSSQPLEPEASIPSTTSIRPEALELGALPWPCMLPSFWAPYRISGLHGRRPLIALSMLSASHSHDS